MLLHGCADNPKYIKGSCFTFNDNIHIVDGVGNEVYYVHFGQIPEDARSLRTQLDISIVDRFANPVKCPEWLK